MYAQGFIVPDGSFLHWVMPWPEECLLACKPVDHPAGQVYEFELDALNYGRGRDGVIPGSRISFWSTGAVGQAVGIELIESENCIHTAGEPIPDQANNYPSKVATYLFEGFGRCEVVEARYQR